MFVDPEGLAVGDRYRSIRDAAVAALQEINPASIAENVEYGGSIYRNSDGSYSYTKPTRGDQTSVYINPIWPLFNRNVGTYHTHGCDAPGNNDGEDFSDDDIALAKHWLYGGIDYIGTPDGWVKEFNPKTGDPETVGRASAVRSPAGRR